MSKSAKGKSQNLPRILPGDRAYFQALGRFIHEFSVVEQEMYRLLLRCTGISDAIGRAVFGPMHIEQSMSLTRHVLQVSSPDPDRDTDIKTSFTQLTHINGFRNDIVHLGAQVRIGYKRWTSNAAKARTKEGWRMYPASPDELADATADLLKIREHVAAYAADSGALGYWSPGMKLLSAAWRYTPPQQRKRK